MIPYSVAGRGSRRKKQQHANQKKFRQTSNAIKQVKAPPLAAVQSLQLGCLFDKGLFGVLVQSAETISIRPFEPSGSIENVCRTGRQLPDLTH